MRQCLVRVKLNLIIGILQYLQQEKTSRKKKKRISFSRKALKYLGIIYPLLRDVPK